MYKPISHVLHSFLLLVLIGTFGSMAYYIKTPPAALSLAPADTWASVTTSAPGYTSTIETMPVDGWSRVQPGLERRVIEVHDQQNQPVEMVHIWRLDQKRFRLDVAFDKHPKTLETWQSETNAMMVVNGGYFSIRNEQYFPDGLTVLHGTASGNSFTGYGGMLAITERDAQVRWLVNQPYDPNERLQAALQAFPILVEPGGRPGYQRQDQAHARRTVIAQDRQGRILFIVTPQGYFTLHQISAYLAASDLDLDIAINLDGGGSTGLLVAEPREVIPSKVLLPFVILVHEK